VECAKSDWQKFYKQDRLNWTLGESSQSQSLNFLLSLASHGKEGEGKRKSKGDAEGAKGLCRHSPDFSCVVWYGAEYTFTPNQAKCVKSLWEAWENGTPDIHHQQILEDAGLDNAKRLVDVFKNHPTWKTLIVSTRKGVYRLNAENKSQDSMRNRGSTVIPL